MQIPVLVEALGQHQFRAEAAAPIALTAEGTSSQEAIENLRLRFEKELSASRQLVMLELSSPKQPPWLKYVGHLKDDPLFDQWQSAIRDYRRQRDEEDGIQTDEQR